MTVPVGSMSESTRSVLRVDIELKMDWQGCKQVEYFQFLYFGCWD